MRILFLLFSLSFTQLLFSQNEQVVVTDILIEGNKKTKEKTILRELDFAFGDTIPTIDLISRLRRSEELLLNTGLFTLVRINIKIWNADTNHISINIELHEMWYLYPFYIFELADRNFNVWWEEQERSLKRINYGGRLTWLNLTGRRDLLKATIRLHQKI